MRNARRSYRMKMTSQQLIEAAQQVCDDHNNLIKEGFELGGKSGAWTRKDGGHTFRFVYRHKKQPRSIVHTIRTYGGAKP